MGDRHDDEHSVREAAAFFGVNKSTIYRRMNDGSLASHSKGGRLVPVYSTAPILDSGVELIARLRRQRVELRHFRQELNRQCDIMAARRRELRLHMTENRRIRGQG